MSKLTIDADLRAKLNGLNQQIEIQDGSGRILGKFLPEDEYQKLIYVDLVIPLSPEETERRRSEKESRPLSEFWREMGVQ